MAKLLNMSGLEITTNAQAESSVAGYPDYIDIRQLSQDKRDQLKEAFTENGYSYPNSDLYIGYQDKEGYIYFKSEEALKNALEDPKVSETLKKALTDSQSAIVSETALAVEPTKDSEDKEKSSPVAEKSNVDRLVELSSQKILTEAEQAEVIKISAALTPEEKQQVKDKVGVDNAKKALNGYEEKNEDNPDEPKSKKQMVQDMFDKGDILGAIMALLFMPEKDGGLEPQSAMLAETKQAAGIPLSSPEALKEAEVAAKKEEPKITFDSEGFAKVSGGDFDDQTRKDMVALAMKDKAKKELEAAKAEVGVAQQELDTLNKRTDLEPEKKAFLVEKATDKLTLANDKVEALSDNPSKYKTSGEKEMEAKLKEAEAEIAKLKPKADELDKQKADAEKNKGEIQKQFEALMAKRSDAVTPEERKPINIELGKLLNSIPSSEQEFKKDLIAIGEKQNKEFADLDKLLAERKEKKLEKEKGIDPDNITGTEEEIRNLKVNGAKAMQNQDKQMQQDGIKAAEAAKLEAERVAEAARVATATNGVKEAVMTLDIGKTGSIEQSLETGSKPDGKINSHEAKNGIKDQKDKITAAVAALDGQAGISPEDKAAFEGILKGMKDVTAPAQKVLLDTIQTQVVQNNKAPAKGAGVGPQ